MIVIVYTDSPLNITETIIISKPKIVNVIVTDEPLCVTDTSSTSTTIPSQTIDEHIYSIRNDDDYDLILNPIQYEIESEDNEIIPIIWCIIIAQILYVYHHFDIDYG